MSGYSGGFAHCVSCGREYIVNGPCGSCPRCGGLLIFNGHRKTRIA